MKPGKWLLLGALLAAAAGSSSAWAHGHANVGVYFGVPLGAPYYYPAPVYAYPSPPVVVVQPPTTYIERDPTPPPSGYWYWCPDSQAYYPQVQSCPTPWQQVPATPANR